MSEVKRYDCTNNGFAYCMGCYVMELADDGLYVRAEDYDSLRAQLAAAEAERDRAVKNEERYLWLRDNDAFDNPPAELALAFKRFAGDMLDHCVDVIKAARASAAGEAGSG